MKFNIGKANLSPRKCFQIIDSVRSWSNLSRRCEGCIIGRTSKILRKNSISVVSTGQASSAEERQDLQNLSTVITIVESLTCDRENLAIHCCAEEGQGHRSFKKSLFAF